MIHTRITGVDYKGRPWFKSILKKGDKFKIRHCDGKEIIEQICEIKSHGNKYLYICESCACYSEDEVKKAQLINKMNVAERLWDILGNIPINENEEIEEQFLDFEAGTCMYYIWHWFEETFNLSVAINLMKI